MNKFSCPECGQRLSSEESVAGLEVECPNCGTAFSPDAASVIEVGETQVEVAVPDAPIGHSEGGLVRGKSAHAPSGIGPKGNGVLLKIVLLVAVAACLSYGVYMLFVFSSALQLRGGGIFNTIFGFGGLIMAPVAGYFLCPILFSRLISKWTANRDPRLHRKILTLLPLLILVITLTLRIILLVKEGEDIGDMESAAMLSSVLDVVFAIAAMVVFHRVGSSTLPVFCEGCVKACKGKGGFFDKESGEKLKESFESGDLGQIGDLQPTKMVQGGYIMNLNFCPTCSRALAKLQAVGKKASESMISRWFDSAEGERLLQICEKKRRK